jgi:hypothetical protein
VVLGDDALEPEAAGVGEDLGAVALQVVDKLDTGFRPPQKAAQRALALQRRSRSEN